MPNHRQIATPLSLLAAALLVACSAPAPDVERIAADSAPADTTWQMAAIPDGPMGASIRRGLAILVATRDSLPQYVGNDLNCMSCHLDQGTRPNGLTLVGVYARFPQYNGRAARVFNLEDRINGCFQRSMNGKPLPHDDPAMRDMVAWMAHASRGVAVGDTVPGQGLPRPQATSGDTIAGAEIWRTTCAVCHGLDGEGTPVAPPTWGPRSFNIGAGMARLRTAAGFIRHNMPFDRPGSLSDSQAVNVAAYLISRPRPDFAGKEEDWPYGGAPVDVAYPVKSQRLKD
jgi:thiosulfate dehydrogenase